MKITLHKASTELAGLYLAIIMAISLFFSATVFQLSLQEFNRGLKGESGIITNLSVGDGDVPFVTNLKERLAQDHELRYQDARQRVLVRLVVTNVIILIGGGFLSYYLARRTLKPIEEAHEAQSRFTADASHELRTPIAAMQSETEVALMDPKLTLTKAKERLKSNLEELSKLTVLSEGLLRLAHLEEGQLPKQSIVLDSMIQRAIRRVVPFAEAKNILITSDVPDGLEVAGDEVSMTEAIVILLDNAIKYSPQKTEITITAHQSPKQVNIAIQDQGIGIKATELPHIFDRFYRADTARSKQHVQGYGLGLAIAKNIVTLHDGRVSAQSKPGQGSTFTISLPRA